MLQKVEIPFEWSDEREITASVTGRRITLEDVSEWGGEVLSIALPPGVVLAQEVDAPADPLRPDAEVRAALRCWHGGASPSVVGYPGIDFPADAITRWVASWPDEA